MHLLHEDAGGNTAVAQHAVALQTAPLVGKWIGAKYSVAYQNSTAASEKLKLPPVPATPGSAWTPCSP